MRIFGFTLLRNGVKYDYSFTECLISLNGVTQKTYLALGNSDDGTQNAVSGLDFLKIIPTVWDESKKEGAIVLSEQTNIALDGLRKDFKEDDDWGFYLQCDEVLHEDDYELILRDFKIAQEGGFDAISFRYLHFWMNHNQVAINKKWYPQEIRAVKLNSSARSWGDAQSFENVNRVYQSEARIFHYGHVRDEEKYREKKRDILTLYHEPNKLKKYQKREIKYDNMTECLDYFGTHPEVMHKRIQRLGDIVSLPEVDDVYIVSREDAFSSGFIKKIKAKNIHWVDSLSKVPKEFKTRAIIPHPNLYQRIFRPSRVPRKMKSKLALDWSNDFRLSLLLSEKRISS